MSYIFLEMVSALDKYLITINKVKRGFHLNEYTIPKRRDENLFI